MILEVYIYHIVSHRLLPGKGFPQDVSKILYGITYRYMICMTVKK